MGEDEDYLLGLATRRAGRPRPPVRRGLAAAALALTVATAGCGAATTPSSSAGLVSIGASLEGSAGLAASVYTDGLANVAALAVDDDGQLWAATAEYDDEGKDTVSFVGARGARPVTVLSGLHTPLGLLWYGGELSVASRGRVDAYRGFDGSAFAEHRTVITLPDGVGASNGLALSPDGRIVLGISAPCDDCVPTSQYAAAIVSFLPDGSDLRIEASGIRAPIGLAYVPSTSELLVTMNQRDDLGAKTPGDWLAAVHRGDNWGFPTCYGQHTPECAAVPSPLAVLDKHAAVAGLVIVDGELGARVGTAAIVAEWATGKVLMVGLTKSGTASGKGTTLLRGVENPVALALTPSGSLLVGDWKTGVVYAIARSMTIPASSCPRLPRASRCADARVVQEQHQTSDERR